MLEAERRIATNQPLPADAEQVRRHQDLLTERRHLEASRDQLVPAYDVVERTRAVEVARQREQVTKLAGEIDRTRDELKQAEMRQRFAEEDLVRVRSLSTSGAGSVKELKERETEAKVLAAEVKKLATQLDHLAGQRSQVQQDVARLEKLAGAQAEAMVGDIERVRRRLAEIPAEEGPVRKQLSEELARAEGRRGAKLEQLALELRQCEAEMSGLERELTVTAPISGRLAYRDPAPRTAFDEAPLCVLAPADAFRLRVRLSKSEAASLGRAGPVVVELDDERQLERRFEARLAGVRAMPH